MNVNGEEQSTLPKDDYDVNNPDANKTYYKVNVTCDNEVEAEWDYNAWNLKITKLDNEQAVNGTKCKLAFNNTDANGLLGMSATERDNIIKQGVQIRRNTYRGKDITKYLENEKLFDMISSGKFDDVYVGDYIVSKNTDESNNKIVWLIADLDNYLGAGDQENGLQQHHATVIPAGNLGTAAMNSEVTTEGYLNSEMVQKTLGMQLEQDDTTILGKYIYPDFKEHVIKYRSALTSKICQDHTNQLHSTDSEQLGASCAYTWQDRYLDLMSEVNVYGTTVWSSSGYDIGIDNRQYAIFQLRPELINQDLDGNRYYYWSKAVLSSKLFATISSTSESAGDSSTKAHEIRPRFLID